MTFIAEIEPDYNIRPRLAEWADEALAEIMAQRERLILWMPVNLALGIGLYFSLRFEPPYFIGAGILAVLLALWIVVWPSRQNSARHFMMWLGLGFLTIFNLGFTAGQTRTMLVTQPVLQKDISPVDVSGRVIAIESLEEGDGTRLLLDDLNIENLSLEQTPRTVRIKVRQEHDLHIGDKVTMLAGLKPPSAPVAVGGFDFQRYAFFKQIGAFGFSYRVPEVIERGKPSGFAQKIEAIREAVELKIGRALAAKEGAVATALMTGERAGIAEDDWDAMRASGLAHMLAISGLHVGLIASIIFMGLRTLMAAFPPLALNYPIKKYAAVAALLGALCYTLLVGATIPTVRALIMTGIVLFAIIVDRMPFSLRLVAIAALAVLLFMPEALTGASFQMSFAAVTCLIFFYEVMRGHLSQWYRQAGFMRRLALYFLGVIMTTVIATLATAPLALFHFQQLAIYSIISNLFAVPLMAFVVMPFAVIGYLLMPLGLSEYPLYVMGKGIEGILSIAHSVTEMPLSTLTPAAFPQGALICFVFAALSLILWKGKGRVLCAVPLLIGMVICMQQVQPMLLVSSSGKLMALLDKQGEMWVSTRRTEKFSAENWARIYGNDPEALRMWRDNNAIRCDESGCRTLWQGQKIAVSKHRAAQTEDCAWADILVSSEPVAEWECNAQTVIDIFNLRDNGAYTIYTDGRVISVADDRGNRPWTAGNTR